MPKITVNNDVNLYYEIFGEGEPLIFIHGFAVDHLVFANIAKSFQEKYQVFLIDNRGSGQSDCPDYSYTVEMMADDIYHFWQRLALKPARIVGHSMGGMIVQQLARRYPQMIANIVICNTEMKLDIRYALSARARLEFMAANCSPRSLIENAMGWTFSSEFLNRPGIIEEIIQLRLANPFPITQQGYRNQLEALLAFDSHSWINQIRVPCLVIGSDQDMIMHESNIKKLAKNIPEASYHCIQGAGHAPFIEQPENFCAIINNFINDK